MSWAIEERQKSKLAANKSAQAAAEVRRINVMQAIATFVPRSKIDKDDKAIHPRSDAVAKRIGTTDGSDLDRPRRRRTAFGAVILSKVDLTH